MPYGAFVVIDIYNARDKGVSFIVRDHLIDDEYYYPSIRSSLFFQKTSYSKTRKGD